VAEDGREEEASSSSITSSPSSPSSPFSLPNDGLDFISRLLAAARSFFLLSFFAFGTRDRPLDAHLPARFAPPRGTTERARDEEQENIFAVVVVRKI
jgi:hypothetical protein